MKIMIFTEGTIIMHRGALGQSREDRVAQAACGEESVYDFASYVPVSNAVAKVSGWKGDGAEIIYLTSRQAPGEITGIERALEKHGFPEGRLLFRRDEETYADIAKSIAPDILIEDDCESIAGKDAMISTHMGCGTGKRTQSIVIKEFGGIDHLPDVIPVSVE